MIECKNSVQQGDEMGPCPLCFVLVPIVSKLRAKHEPLGVRIKAYMDDINLYFKEITQDDMQVVPDLVEELEVVDTIVQH